MSRWLEKIYQRLWGQVGGRSWTEVIRDDQRRSPLLYMMVFLALGIMVGKLAARYWWQIMLGFLLGVLCGHFWW